MLGKTRTIERILISEKAIKTRIRKLASQIAHDYKHLLISQQPLPVVIVLKGAFVFAADLIRELNRCGLRVKVEFIWAQSYRDQTKPGELELDMDALSGFSSGEEVLFIEDIYDTGQTLSKIFKRAKELGLEIKGCVLLEKPARHIIKLHIEYVGFRIGNFFVVGYGLDYQGEYRDLPYIGVLSKKVQT